MLGVSEVGSASKYGWFVIHTNRPNVDDLSVMSYIFQIWMIYVCCYLYGSLKHIWITKQTYNSGCAVRFWHAVTLLSALWKLNMMLQVPKIIMCMCLCVLCFCPRSGPNWRDLREPLGHWELPLMLPVVSTMERSNPSCWSPVEWITMTTLCRMYGSWMSTLGGGGRWVMMCIWMCDWFNWLSLPI